MDDEPSSVATGEGAAESVGLSRCTDGKTETVVVSTSRGDEGEGCEGRDEGGRRTVPKEESCAEEMSTSCHPFCVFYVRVRV